MEGEIFFSGWEPLIRTTIIAVVAYPGMLLMVRLSGNRTLAQLNAFDFIVTVALGSTLASVIISNNTALAQGLLAFALLIVMQLAISWATSRWKTMEGLVKAEPVLLFRRGEFLRDAMRRVRITEDEIKAVTRSEGQADMRSLEAVILETNGKLSVVPGSETAGRSALEAVPGYEDEPGKG